MFCFARVGFSFLSQFTSRRRCFKDDVSHGEGVREVSQKALHIIWCPVRSFGSYADVKLGAPVSLQLEIPHAALVTCYLPPIPPRAPLPMWRDTLFYLSRNQISTEKFTECKFFKHFKLKFVLKWEFWYTKQNKMIKNCSSKNCGQRRMCWNVL
jgi:hypothetical protein